MRQTADGMTGRQDGQVARRRVFYIPGYDPFHPRRYRELYRSESAAQAAISGYRIALEPGTGDTPQGWRVNAQVDGADVRAEVEVLVWSDIVRGSMGQSILASYWQLLRTAWTYTASGAIFRLARLRKGPTIAALYPIAMLLVQLVVAVGLGILAFYLFAVASEWAMVLVRGEEMAVSKPLRAPDVSVDVPGGRGRHTGPAGVSPRRQPALRLLPDA